MSYERAKKFRRLQHLGVLVIAGDFLMATITYEYTGSFASWSILAIVGAVVTIFCFKAAKMEVIENLNMTLGVYERVRKKEAERAIRRLR